MLKSDWVAALCDGSPSVETYQGDMLRFFAALTFVRRAVALLNEHMGSSPAYFAEAAAKVITFVPQGS